MKGGGWEVGGDMWMARDERCRGWRQELEGEKWK